VCKITFMKITFIAVTAILAAGTMMAGSARAQQTPAANPIAAPPAKAKPAAKAPAASASKTGKTPAAAAKAPAAKNQGAVSLDSPKAKASYAIGLNIGKGMSKSSVDVDPDILMQGLKDGLSGGKALMTDEEIKAELNQLQAQVRQAAEEKARQLGEENKKEGESFLAANKEKEGVVTLPDGLEYKILTAGTGPKPTASDTVICNYRGTLINGTEFDSSYKRGQPATFPVGQVIRGWTEALQLMPVGSKWQIFIPGEMAYGPRGAGPDIGPNATLIFEVELLSIQPKPAAAPPAPAAPPVPSTKE
jgi:FKBP-type peptidyl-prolyl cis-trans isomerase FklB